MTLIPDTIAGRTIAVLLVGLGLFHFLSLWFYQSGLHSEVELASESGIAERIVTIKQTLLTVPAKTREDVAHSLSGGTLQVHVTVQPLVTILTNDKPIAIALRARIKNLLPDLAESNLLLGLAHAQTNGSVTKSSVHGEPALIVSLQGPEKDWINFSIRYVEEQPASLHGAIGSTTTMAIGIILVSILLLRWLTRPIRSFADAVRATYIAHEVRHVPVEGSREIRDLANAFNDMQDRIKKLVDDRTQTLAAISHDLKTPLTRLRLRAEDVATGITLNEINADIDEMEAMIDASLAFLRGDQSPELIRPVDIFTLLSTIVDDLEDRGNDVTLSGKKGAVVRARSLSLKRAFTNLIWNAVKYGKCARIEVTQTDTFIVVRIEDDGAGIQERDMEMVFEPFRRLETSRSRETGGVGLGLTIARTVLRKHGGDVTLINRIDGGLCAEVKLPVFVV